MEEELHRRVIGQEQAIKALSQAIRRQGLPVAVARSRAASFRSSDPRRHVADGRRHLRFGVARGTGARGLEHQPRCPPRRAEWRGCRAVRPS